MKAAFMALALLAFTASLFIPSSVSAQIVESNEAPFVAHVRLDYQMAPAAYVKALDQKLSFTLGEEEEIIVRFKDTSRHTRLVVTIVNYDKDNNTLNGVITREDFRDNKTYNGGITKASFRHVLGNGTSVIRLRGQDPLSSGPFRFRLDF